MEVRPRCCFHHHTHTQSYGNKKTNLIYPFPHQPSSAPRVLFSAPSILHRRLLLVHIDFGPLKGTCVSEPERERREERERLASVFHSGGTIRVCTRCCPIAAAAYYVKLALCANIFSTRACVFSVRYRGLKGERRPARKLSPPRLTARVRHRHISLSLYSPSRSQSAPSAPSLSLLRGCYYFSTLYIMPPSAPLNY